MLKNTLKTALLLTVTIILTSCAPSTVRQIEEEQNTRQLTPDQILLLVEGNTLLFVSFNEDSFFYFDTSGRVYGLDIYENKDIGRWDVTESGELCIIMQRWWHSDMKCLTVYTDGSRISLANNAGVIDFKATRYEGDYKKQYYEPKNTKKSYRNSSIQKKISEQQGTKPLSDTSKKTVLTEKQVNDERPTAQVSDAELKTTVKWMAKDCPGCNLAGSNLSKANLVGAKLTGTDLSGANLSMADMRRANLQSANLENANLKFANMPGANLRNCNLKNANLEGANLIRADLTDANLEGAILDGALLEGVRGMN